ncbi:MAG: hypothetical protein NC213_06960 [Acetobacter sp.]|nr:hypothetical protein [Bacteroides sp.]MCM1341467.1 hypothetical protein [Acetobacter sp.]MCM1433419.1 hypothetical protein [Clostridiales bacterium]
MSKEEKKAKKLAKKEEKQAKNQAKAEKVNAKAKAKADKKHAKAYDSFVKDTEKKNKKLEEKAAKSGADFTPIAIPAIDVFQTKKEIKAMKAGKKAYAKYVKKIDKKNAKAEKKCAKKGKPFVPAVVPTEEEFLNSAAGGNKVGKIILMIILILLIWFLIYFMFTYINYEYRPHVAEETTTSAEGEPAVYDEYSNPHEMTTTPDYSIADAKLYLKQVLSDNWSNLGYSSDPSGSAISYNNRIEKIYGADCYMFTCGGKTFGVAVKLSAAYYCHNGDYTPVGFNDTNILFGE